MAAEGPGVALSQRPAAALWELRRLRTMLVDVVAPRRVRLREPIRTHHTRLALRDVTTYRGGAGRGDGAERRARGAAA